jgi:ketosteroid isomerase-like protein
LTGQSVAATKTGEVDPAVEELLRRAYRAFNERDVEAVLATMHAEVDWPNAWEGGRVAGRDAVAVYWARQFEAISSTVEPLAFVREDDSAIAVSVRQTVDDARTGERLSEATVTHRYRIEDGLIARMDVLE